MHLRKTEAIYFSVEDWTVDSALNPHANFDFWRMELRARGAVSVDPTSGTIKQNRLDGQISYKDRRSSDRKAQ
jgi:hypothetical protein